MKRPVLSYTGIRAIALAFIISMPVYAGTFLDETAEPSPLKNRSERASVYELQNAFNQVYENYRDSVVFISTEKTVKVRYYHPFMEDPFLREFFGQQEQKPRTRKQKGLGTGFIISSNGYICTNHHVVAKMDTVTVTVGDKTYPAKIVGSDPLTDIALLKIKGRTSFRPVHFGDSDSVKIGDMSIAIGNPFGLEKTITTGIISATGRRQVDMIGNSHIQTDASINPGNSGGPLINLDGEVIGVNRMIYSRSGGNLGIGFAIPINTARDVLLDLKKYGKVKRGYIGVNIAMFTKQLANELGLKKPEGALIGAVEKNGPADKAGLRQKDVITRINGKKIKSYKDLLRIVSRAPINSTVNMTVWRDRKNRNFRVKITERP